MCIQSLILHHILREVFLLWMMCINVYLRQMLLAQGMYGYSGMKKVILWKYWNSLVREFWTEQKDTDCFQDTDTSSFSKKIHYVVEKSIQPILKICWKSFMA